MKQVLRRYMFSIIAILALGGLTLVDYNYGAKAVGVIGFSLKEMLLVIPPVFILLGLLDVWVPREAMIKFMGENSGIKGILLALFLGSAAAGPLYAAFPVSLVLMKKGARLSNVLIFIGAWSTTKIPMFLFEMASLGKAFAFTRLLINIPGIIIIAYLLEKMTTSNEKEDLQKRILSMDAN
ncbi:permease [Alkaliphilus serpentinus]|uniref:Permease n=1 Tax=Alkaliphilus serpentinus TaxID=1482731 RepID=A0A833HQM2_9FIRM|nr:permease [Alkaliphilus serpentinus]KAB3532047.1 permease [Alkaliphilus serpentinus]